MAQYVKFYRGTLDKYLNSSKNSDTLYFITDPNSNKASLYLGADLISGNISNFSELSDVLLSDGLADKHMLIYEEASQKWVNKSIVEAIGVMVGASQEAQGSNGLVPAPGPGMQNAFLRGDGTWVKIEGSENTVLTTDEKSLSNVNNIISLKNFGVKYYKFIPESGSIENGDYVESYYEIQIVDEAHPWLEGLEPKVVEEDGELILGWFEPNPTTIDGINTKITILENKVGALELESSEVKDVIAQLQESVEAKANADEVYTKTETDEKIAGEILKAEHLRRKTFASLEEAQSFIQTITNPEQYIYMILTTTSEDNKYDEYLYIDGVLEKIGAWATDLTDYVTKEELNEGLGFKVDARIGFDLISLDDLTKLSEIEEKAQVNKIETVNEEEFTLNEKHLSLKAIPISKVTNLEEILNQKALQSDVDTLGTSIEDLDTKVGNLESLLNESYVTKDDLAEELAELKAAMTWQDL